MEIAQGQTVRIRARAGLRVRCLRGQVRLIQGQEHCLPGGTSYSARAAGDILVSSLSACSVIALQADAPAADPGRVRIESFEQVAAEARRMRSRMLLGRMA